MAQTPTAAELAEVEYRRRFILITTIILLILSTLSVILRLVSRWVTRSGFGWDDFFMCLSLPFSYIPGICNLIGLSYGLGKHVWMVSKPDQETIRKLLFATQRGNPPCLFCVKTSILIFYMHIFNTATFKKYSWAMIILTGMWAISTFFSNLLQCLPVAYFWDKTIPGGKCLNVTPIGVANGALSLVGDVIILFMPLPMIWNLQLKAAKKGALTGIFLLGGFVCVISLIRVIVLKQLDIKDAPYSQTYPGVLTHAELAIAILCANLPILGPLLGRAVRKHLGSSRSKPTGYVFGQDGIATTRSAIVTGNATRHGRERDGFSRMNDFNRAADDTGSGSDVELTSNIKGPEGHAITVRTEIALDYNDRTGSYAASDPPSRKGHKYPGTAGF